MVRASVNIMTENIAAIPGPSTGGVAEIQIPDESITGILAEKRTKNVKVKTGIEKSKDKTLKDMPPPKEKTMKRKAVHPPTSEMVMDSIKTLEKRKGVTLKDIKKHLEEKYTVNMKVMARHVENFLQKGVGNGLLAQTDGVGVEGRFKIKKLENTERKALQNLHGKRAEKKPVKKIVESKKTAKK